MIIQKRISKIVCNVQLIFQNHVLCNKYTEDGQEKKSIKIVLITIQNLGKESFKKHHNTISAS
ncbi:MAG: hypothetical protein D3925_01490 [Candidatus Electrothrix sp. AR5]|nr:hypothetical protein [Candidatus Electrothrix sp. AR5]